LKKLENPCPSTKKETERKAWKFSLKSPIENKYYFLHTGAEDPSPFMSNLDSHVFVRIQNCDKDLFEFTIVYRERRTVLGAPANFIDLEKFYIGMSVSSEHASVTFFFRNSKRFDRHVLFHPSNLFSVFRVRKIEDLSFFLELSLTKEFSSSSFV
jgi:hypothetical protein